MKEFVFNIGSKVYCQDGQCGDLQKIVFDVHTEEITDLVVSKGTLLKKDRVVPISAVANTDEDAIHLALSSEALEDFPEFKEIEREVSAISEDTKEARSVQKLRLWRLNPYGPIFNEPVTATIREQIHVGIDDTQTVVERGTPVFNDEGEIGTVDHVLMGRESRLLTHIIVDRGLLNHAILVPKTFIKEVSQDGIYVNAAEETLEMLSQYIRRADEDILADFQEQVNALDIDSRSLKAEVDQGILQLTGMVRDVAAKRQLESTARAIEGVIDVENDLDTHTGTVARVTAALDADPRTELAVIEVINENGLITLKGQVDNQEIAQAAEAVAKQQQGVIRVINALEPESEKAVRSIHRQAVFTRPDMET